MADNPGFFDQQPIPAPRPVPEPPGYDLIREILTRKIFDMQESPLGGYTATPGLIDTQAMHLNEGQPQIPLGVFGSPGGGPPQPPTGGGGLGGGRGYGGGTRVISGRPVADMDPNTGYSSPAGPQRPPVPDRSRSGGTDILRLLAGILGGSRQPRNVSRFDGVPAGTRVALQSPRTFYDGAPGSNLNSIWGQSGWRPHGIAALLNPGLFGGPQAWGGGWQNDQNGMPIGPGGFQYTGSQHEFSGGMSPEARGQIAGGMQGGGPSYAQWLMEIASRNRPPSMHETLASNPGAASVKPAGGWQGGYQAGPLKGGAGTTPMAGVDPYLKQNNMANYWASGQGLGGGVQGGGGRGDKTSWINDPFGGDWRGGQRPTRPPNLNIPVPGGGRPIWGGRGMRPPTDVPNNPSRDPILRNVPVR